MLVKDSITGLKIDKDTAYKVESLSKSGKKTTKYYSSEEAYNKHMQNKQNRQKCIDEMYRILDYKSFMKIPTLFYKKLSEWGPYGYDVILNCIKDNEKSISWALLNKTFKQETSKIMYICAILENHMNDSLKKTVVLNEILDNSADKYIESEIDLNSIGSNEKKYTKDISRFLED